MELMELMDMNLIIGIMIGAIVVLIPVTVCTVINNRRLWKKLRGEE